DFLYAGFPGMTRYAREYAKRRAPDGNMNRLYVVESTPSSTGVKADNRLPLRTTEIESFVRVLAAGVGIEAGVNGWAGDRAGGKFLSAIVQDLQNHRGSSVIIPGEHQSPTVHALVHGMNQALGNAGRTVVYTDPVNANPINQTESLRDLVNDMR
ncbi:MAG: molybdopterin oxidoreductase, partial [Acidobacteria bacterium]